MDRTCPVCGGGLARKQRTFCSRACSGRSRRRAKPVRVLERLHRGLDLSGVACERFADRFWSKVDPSGYCWEWTAHRLEQGYGQFTVSKGAFFGAHRVSYALTHGPIPAGMVVCHRCDNPPCVNPDHLFLGTYVDNAMDSVAKRRARRVSGEAHPSARLTEDAVRAIRLTPRYRGRIKDLASLHGVSTHAIRQILLGRTWRHVIVEPVQLSLFESVDYEEGQS